MGHRENAAVSPVIGVILMVAITVVMSAFVFLLVQHLNGRSEGVAPTVGFGIDDSDSEVMIARAPAGVDELDWHEDVIISGTCTPTLNGAPFPVASGTPVRAGDVLACAPGEELRISSSPSQGNALLFDHEFAG